MCPWGVHTRSAHARSYLLKLLARHGFAVPPGPLKWSYSYGAGSRDRWSAPGFEWERSILRLEDGLPVFGRVLVTQKRFVLEQEQGTSAVGAEGRESQGVATKEEEEERALVESL